MLTCESLTIFLSRVLTLPLFQFCSIIYHCSAKCRGKKDPPNEARQRLSPGSPRQQGRQGRGRVTAEKGTFPLEVTDLRGKKEKLAVVKQVLMVWACCHRFQGQSSTVMCGLAFVSEYSLPRCVYICGVLQKAP